MPYQGFPDGLYLLRRPSDKGIHHYGVLDIGNRLQLTGVSVEHPVVAHQTPPSIRFDWFQNTGAWESLGRVVEEPAALERLRLALFNPRYDLFGNNCEQFARFVTTGRRECTQLQAVIVVVGLAALVVVVARAEAA